MAKFALDEEPTKKIFTRKGLAYSSMSTLMKTTADECETTTFPPLGDKILEDCALNSPPLPSEYNCNNKHSCEFFREKVAELLDGTLGEWNKRFEFHSTLVSPFEPQPIALIEPIVSSKGGCPLTRGDRDTSGLFPLQTDVGLVDSVLYICD